jgi:hypothetical protein
MPCITQVEAGNGHHNGIYRINDRRRQLCCALSAVVGRMRHSAVSCMCNYPTAAGQGPFSATVAHAYSVSPVAYVLLSSITDLLWVRQELCAVAFLTLSAVVGLMRHSAVSLMCN